MGEQVGAGIKNEKVLDKPIKIIYNIYSLSFLPVIREFKSFEFSND